jgi:hypothetical protein
MGSLEFSTALWRAPWDDIDWASIGDDVRLVQLGREWFELKAQAEAAREARPQPAARRPPLRQLEPSGCA